MITNKVLFLVFSLSSMPAAAGDFHMVTEIPASRDGTCLDVRNSGSGFDQKSRDRIKAVMNRLRDLKLEEERYLKPLKFVIVNRRLITIREYIMKRILLIFWEASICMAFPH